MPSHKRLFALAALAALVAASLASPASAGWCGDQRARCIKRCGKESDIDFHCSDKPNARSVSCSCANGASGFSGGDNGASSFAGSGGGAFAGTGLGMSPDQVARDGFNNVARVARGENPVFFGGGGGDNGGGDSGAAAGGSGTKQSGSYDASPTGKVVSSTSSSPSTPAWAVALAVIASLVAATCAGALGFVVMRRSHERKAAAMATPSLPMFESSKPSFAPSSPNKSGHATL